MSYIRYSVTLTDNQKKKIADAVKSGKGTRVRLSYDELTGPISIMITQQQMTSINKARREKKGVELTLSKTQLSKQGGILPFLVPLIPALVAAGKAAALGAAGAAGASGVKAIVDAVSQKGSGLKVLGKGVFLPGRR